MSDDVSLPTEEEHAIRERLAKATPGPWFASKVMASGEFTIRVGTGMADDSSHQRNRPVARITHNEVAASIDYGDEGDTTNADFIAHAPTDIARLLDALDTERVEIERLEGENARLRLAVGAGALTIDAVIKKYDTAKAALGEIRGACGDARRILAAHDAESKGATNERSQ